MGSRSKQNINFDGLCRACMQEILESITTTEPEGENPHQSWQSLLSWEASCGALQIADILNATTPQLIVKTNDELPQKICRECLIQLVNTYKFQQMCMASDREMRKYLQHCESAAQGLPNIVALPLASMDLLQLNDNASKGIVQIKPEVVLPFEAETCLKKSSNVNDFGESFSEESKGENALSNPAKVESIPNSALDTALTDDQSSESRWDDIPLTLRKLRQKIASNIAKRKTAVVEKLIDPGEQTDVTPFSCSQCEKVFVRKCYLSRHLKKHHQIANLGRNKGRSVKISTLEFACEVCAKTFKSRYKLKKHEHVHKEERPYVCEYCNKNFKISKRLKVHLRLHTEGPYLCSECGRIFNSKESLKQHLLRHSGVKSFECPQCPKKFTTIAGLAAHKGSHRVEKPYVCDQCGSAFLKSYHLRKHKFIHTGEKPHKCKYCEMRFVRADHMRRHMLTHTGEKPYKCKYCERAFAQSNDCIKHLRSHLGENVYRCEFCPGAFRKAADLRKHLPLHKNEDEETREKNKKALMEEGRRFGLSISHK